MYMKPVEDGQENTKSADYYFQKGVAKYQNGNYKSAIEDFQQAILLEPNDTVAIQKIEELSK